LAGLLAFVWAGWRWQAGKRTSAPQIHSIAVLPLANLSGNADEDYFADGMTEELTTELAQISALRVISHTSAAQYKNTKKSLPEIARELNVDAVVEGAVERAGDKVAITVQLVNASSDRHLWANSYERDLRDVLALQREVTHTIVNEIQAKLTRSEQAHLASAEPVESRPFDEYLRGRFSLEKGDLNKSVAHFQEAINEEPNYALAYAGLANAYISMGQPWFADVSPSEVLPLAKAAARRALELDDSIGATHLAMARVIQLYDWHWPAVEKEYRRSIDLNPNDAYAHAAFGEYLQETGRNEEALAESQRAAALDPLNPGQWVNVGDVFYTSRQYDEAIPIFRRALDLDPENVYAHLGLGWVYEKKLMFPQAIAELKKAVDLGNRHEAPLASLGQVLAESGRKHDAEEVLRELKGRSAHRYVLPCLIALVQIGLGERDPAIASLEQGYANRDQWMLYLKVDPHMDDLRSDPRFQDLLRRLAFPS
jgi:TolB-like protein/Tfp pilus assembly protein PilF